MKKLELSQGYFALVDDEDYELLSKHRWYYNNCGYAMRRAKKNELVNWPSGRVALHRSLFEGIGKSDEVDHVNGDRLDNRKSNLRLCVRSQNNMNQCLRKDNTSGHKGVYWRSDSNKWRASISAFGKRLHLGSFQSKTDAIHAYAEAAKRMHGDFIRKD